MEAAVNTELDAKRKEEQAQLEKLQNERCFIGHPFGIGIVSFKFFMTSLTSYGSQYRFPVLFAQRHRKASASPRFRRLR